MKRLLSSLLVVMLLLLFCSSVEAGRVYPALGSLTGGGTGALDKISHGDLSDGDAAVVILNTRRIYFYTFESTSSASESSPDVIYPERA